jgi:uncharacterized protein YciI
MLTMWLCFDKPNSLDVRMKARPTHLEWIEKAVKNFKFAGPMLSDDGQTLKGSVVVAEFDSLEQSRDVQKQDPYVAAGLFEKVVVCPTKQMFPKV